MTEVTIILASGGTVAGELLTNEERAELNVPAVSTRDKFVVYAGPDEGIVVVFPERVEAVQYPNSRPPEPRNGFQG